MEIGYLPRTERFACAYSCGFDKPSGCDLFNSLSEVETCISDLGIRLEEVAGSIRKFHESQKDFSMNIDIMNAIDDVEKLEEMYQLHGSEAVNPAIDLLDKYNRILESGEASSLTEQECFEAETENILLESEQMMDMSLSR